MTIQINIRVQTSKAHIVLLRALLSIGQIRLRLAVRSVLDEKLVTESKGI